MKTFYFNEIWDKNIIYHKPYNGSSFMMIKDAEEVKVKDPEGFDYPYTNYTEFETQFTKGYILEENKIYTYKRYSVLYSGIHYTMLNLGNEIGGGKIKFKNGKLYYKKKNKWEETHDKTM